MKLSHPSLLNIMEGEQCIYYAYPHKIICYFGIILHDFALYSQYLQIIPEFGHHLRTILHFNLNLGQFWILHSMNCQQIENIPVFLLKFNEIIKSSLKQTDFLFLPGKQVKQDFLFYFEGFDPSTMQFLSEPSKSRCLFYHAHQNDSFHLVFLKSVLSDSFLEIVPQLHQYVQTIDIKLFFLVYSFRNRIVGIDGLIISKSEKNSDAFFNYLQTRDFMKNFQYVKPSISQFRKFARRIPFSNHKIIFSQLETLWQNIKSTDSVFLSKPAQSENKSKNMYFSVIQSNYSDAYMSSEYIIIPSISTTIYILDQSNLFKIREYLSTFYRKYSHHFLIFTTPADRDLIMKLTPISKLHKIKLLTSDNLTGFSQLIADHISKY